MGRNGFIRVPERAEKGRQWRECGLIALGAEMVGRPAMPSSCPRELLTCEMPGFIMRTEKTVGSENILVWCSIETLHREVVGPRQRGE